MLIRCCWAQVLVLADAEFFPFRDSKPVTELSGDALRLREGATAARQAFCEEVRQGHVSAWWHSLCAPVFQLSRLPYGTFCGVTYYRNCSLSCGQARHARAQHP